MKRTKNARIINVGSIVAKYATDFKADTLDQFPGATMVYHHSKLCNILFTQELARRLKDTNITTYSIHPGTVKTNIFRHMHYLLQLLFNVTGTFFFKVRFIEYKSKL